MDSGIAARHFGRPHVDAYLASLSPWDLLYLRDGFRKGVIKITGLATISDLPVEILSIIAQRLGLEDLITCRLVSRSWHSAWTQGAITAAICHYFFPGLLEKYRLEGDSRTPGELLQSSLIRNLQHKHASPLKSSFILWNRRLSSAISQPFQGQDPGADGPDELILFRTRGPPVFYDRGTLAWQPDSACVIVDNLRTFQRQMCCFVDSILSGERMRLQGMSSSLLVFAASNSEMAGLNYNIIKIWHIESREWKRVLLPGPFARCYVEGERVAVTTRQELIIKWSWRGSAVELDQSGILNTVPEGYDAGKSLPGVILHPSEQGVSYIARIYRSKPKSAVSELTLHSHSEKRTFLMSVVRYDDLVPTQRWQEKIHEDSLSHAPHDSLHVGFRLTLLCSKMSANGLYSIGTVLTASHDLEQPRVVEFATTGFNVYKEAFIQRRFEYADQADRSSLRCCRRILDQTTWGCSDHEESLTSWSQDQLLTPRWFTFHGPHPVHDKNELCAGIDPYMRELNKCVPVSEPCRIYGDEDFRVLVTNHGIMVWSFTRDTQLPVGGSLSSPGLALSAERRLMDPIYPVDIKSLAG